MHHPTIQRWSGGSHRPALLLALLALIALLSPAGKAEALPERPLCQVCRRYCDTSPARAMASIPVARHSEAVNACSLFCLCEMLEDFENEPETICMVNYETRDDDIPSMLNIDGIAFLKGAQCDEEKTSAPFYLAFINQESAERAKKEIGGEVITSEKALAECRKLAEEWEPEKKQHRSRPKVRNPH